VRNKTESPRKRTRYVNKKGENERMTVKMKDKNSGRQ
jgi:hypothetical protein